MKTKQSYKIYEHDVLKKMVHEKQSELFDLRFQAASNQLKKFDSISKARKDVARMLTELSSK